RTPFAMDSRSKSLRWKPSDEKSKWSIPLCQAAYERYDFALTNYRRTCCWAGLDCPQRRRQEELSQTFVIRLKALKTYRTRSRARPVSRKARSTFFWTPL